MTGWGRRGLKAAWLAVAFLVLLPAVAAQPSVEIRPEPAAPLVGAPVTFHAQLQNASLNVTQWAWDFGDGTLSNEAQPQHTYRVSGVHTVRLTLTFDDGSTVDASPLSLSVKPAPAPTPMYPAWLYWVMPLIVGFILLSIALVVLLRGQPVIYNRVFFMLYAASAFKSFTEFGFYLTYFNHGEGHALILPLLGLNRAIAFLYPHFFLWFVVVFPRPLRPWLKNGWRGSVLLLLSLPFFALEYALDLGTVLARNVFNAYVSVLALVALGLLVYHAWETDSPEERHRIRLLAVTFFLLVFSTIVVAGLQFLSAAAEGAVAAEFDALALSAGLIFVPMVEILGCLLLMYAILRYQLLGVDLFLKRVTRATTFAVSVGFVFVVVSNSVEQLFQVKFLAGIPLDFIVAGFLSTFMMYPIQKMAERVANRLFPNAQHADHLAARRLEIYEAQLRYALLDGVLKEKELTMLHALRDSLELRPDELTQVVRRFPNAKLGALFAPTAALRSL